MKYTASISFGKDSLAMLLRLIEEGHPLDEVIFYDTGMEFKAIYDIRDKVKSLLREHRIKYVELQPAVPFSWTMFEKPVNVGKYNFHYGYSWCGGTCRWGTTDKLKTIDKWTERDEAVVYVGIAVDEEARLAKDRKPYKRFPLADWNMTEKDCLQYCYDRGFYWEENGIRLYDVLDRVSCWCCANKNLKELKNIYRYMPEYWNKLREMQSKLNRPMKGYYDKAKTRPKGVFELEERFSRELETSE